jgi:hypothetical protein
MANRRDSLAGNPNPVRVRGAKKSKVLLRELRPTRLPPLVRAKILEYVDEKIAGSYGHSKTLIRRFTARLSGKGFNQARTNFAGSLG